MTLKLVDAPFASMGHISTERQSPVILLKILVSYEGFCVETISLHSSPISTVCNIVQRSGDPSKIPGVVGLLGTMNVPNFKL